MSEAAKRKTKPAPKLAAVELMATPKHMLAWLRSKKPRAIVTRDLISCTKCLGANFLTAKGFPADTFRHNLHDFIPLSGTPAGWLGRTINDLPDDKAITAAQAIAAIKRAAKASS